MARIITLKIAGTEFKADAGSTILDIARANEVFIPTLCSLRFIAPEKRAAELLPGPSGL